MKKLIQIVAAAGRVEIAWRGWRVARRMKRVEKDCRWIEQYARNRGLPRSARKKIFNKMGKLVFGLSVVSGVGQPQSPPAPSTIQPS
jgi:hypothetical protein